MGRRENENDTGRKWYRKWFFHRVLYRPGESWRKGAVRQKMGQNWKQVTSSSKQNDKTQRPHATHWFNPKMMQGVNMPPPLIENIEYFLIGILAYPHALWLCRNTKTHVFTKFWIFSSFVSILAKFQTLHFNIPPISVLSTRKIAKQGSAKKYTKQRFTETLLK